MSDLGHPMAEAEWAKLPQDTSQQTPDTEKVLTVPMATPDRSSKQDLAGTKAPSPFVQPPSTVPESPQSDQKAHDPRFVTPKKRPRLEKREVAASTDPTDPISDTIPPSSPPASVEAIIKLPLALAACLIRYRRETGKDFLVLWTDFTENGLGDLSAFSKASTLELVALGVAKEWVQDLQNYVERFIVIAMRAKSPYEEMFWG